MPAPVASGWSGRRVGLAPTGKRTHTDAQIAAIAASIKEWGWTTPALVGEDGGLIAAHARVLAARQLGIARREGLQSAAKEGIRALALADAAVSTTGAELLRHGEPPGAEG